MKLIMENWRRFLTEWGPSVDELHDYDCEDLMGIRQKVSNGELTLDPMALSTLEARLEYCEEEDDEEPLAEQEGEGAKIHFMDWLIDKTERVHSKPGQGSIFAKPTKEVVEIVKKLAASAGDVDKVANTTGVLSSQVPGIGYDLVARVVNGKPVDPRGKPIKGQLTTVEKEEGPNKVPVKAIVTDHPLEAFKTDDLTVIVRPMKDGDGNVLPGEYIILSAFPGTTGADERASEWGDKYVVVVPK
tara:strand:- start:45 stop:776 length:732 start_codon:yes stop_codon:yes gene_type:complete